MTKKEISELRRRFQVERTAITRICGCYVNTQGEIVSWLDESLGLMPEEEAAQYLGLLKKVLSGKPGKNLLDIVFSTEQVEDSDEHRALLSLRDTELKDLAGREAFCRKIIDTLEMEQNYLILLACDAYDVPRRGRGGQRAEDADTTYRYIVCAVCPVKDGKLALGYFSGDNEFHNCPASQLVAAPALGFIFPAFDDRTANIYNALYYIRQPGEPHHEFIDGVFHVEPPMTAAEQRETFEGLLAEAGLNRLEVVLALYEGLRALMDSHRDSGDDEPLTLPCARLEELLAAGGASSGELTSFRALYSERFGPGVVLPPENLIDAGRLEVKLTGATVSVDPDFTGLIDTRELDGKRYILLPAQPEAELNGLSVRMQPAAEEDGE